MDNLEILNAGKALVITVNMGYGHQRTSYPLKELAYGGIIFNANNYPGIVESDRKFWSSSQGFYEFISDFKRIPVIGEPAFAVFDSFQKILQFYPKRDLSKPSMALSQIYSMMARGWGRDLIENLTKYSSDLRKPLPVVSTFFTPAFMAEFFNYPGEIYCVICDADISRSWAPFNPDKSRIKYFAPTDRAAERMELYGIPKNSIFLTGYPLPKEMIGSEDMEILKNDLKNRLLNLDPDKAYIQKYQVLVESQLGQLPQESDHILTIMFSVGGAGAQKEIGLQIIQNLSKEIRDNKLKIILSAGIRKGVRDYFYERIKKQGLERYLGNGIEVLYSENIENYFHDFDMALRKTDILWTKPSELSFYSALGIPVLISPTIGSQEDFNKRWLLKSGFGMLQENPAYVRQWLFDWLEHGYFAEAAMQGFVEGEKMGTFNIEKIISKEME